MDIPRTRVAKISTGRSGAEISGAQVEAALKKADDLRDRNAALVEEKVALMEKHAAKLEATAADGAARREAEAALKTTEAKCAALETQLSASSSAATGLAAAEAALAEAKGQKSTLEARVRGPGGGTNVAFECIVFSRRPRRHSGDVRASLD